MGNTVIEGRISHDEFVIVPQTVTDAVNEAGIWQDKSIYIKPLSGGLNNENWYARDNHGTTYFLKVPGVGTGFIDRSAGDAGTQKASELGIGAKVYEFDSDNGVEITEFLEGYDTCTTTTLRILEQGMQVMDIYRKLHESQPFDHTNTLFEQIDQHLAQVRELNIDLPAWVLELIDDYKDVKARFMASGLDIVPCHNDPMPGNFMVKDGTMKIIDFEFCGNNESSCELALWLSEMFYDSKDSMPLIEEYLGTITTDRLSRIQASRVIGDIKWGLWGVIASAVRDVAFDYWKYGIWKLMRAYTYRSELDWDQVKANI